jgi:hypothetical protein
MAVRGASHGVGPPSGSCRTWENNVVDLTAANTHLQQFWTRPGCAESRVRTESGQGRGRSLARQSGGSLCASENMNAIVRAKAHSAQARRWAAPASRAGCSPGANDHVESSTLVARSRLNRSCRDGDRFAPTLSRTVAPTPDSSGRRAAWCGHPALPGRRAQCMIGARAATGRALPM